MVDNLRPGYVYYSGRFLSKPAQSHPFLAPSILPRCDRRRTSFV